MRHSWKTSPVTVIFIMLGMLLGSAIVLGIIHGHRNAQYLVSAVTAQMDSHSGRIAALLSEPHGGSPSQIGDAIYEELRSGHSTSLITRSMVSVRQSAGAVLECVIDTTSLGVQARRIQERNRQ